MQRIVEKHFQLDEAAQLRHEIKQMLYREKALKETLEMRNQELDSITAEIARQRSQTNELDCKMESSLALTMQKYQRLTREDEAK